MSKDVASSASKRKIPVSHSRLQQTARLGDTVNQGRWDCHISFVLKERVWHFSHVCALFSGADGGGDEGVVGGGAANM